MSENEIIDLILKGMAETPNANHTIEHDIRELGGSISFDETPIINKMLSRGWIDHAPNSRGNYRITELGKRHVKK
mgnify:CR=1 FL=1